MRNGRKERSGGHPGRIAVVAITMVVVGGCAHVNRDELHAELDQVRMEMRQGDEAVATRLSTEIETAESRLASRVASLEGSLRSLEGEFQAVVERFESAIRFNAPVHFAFDDATVRPQDRPVLDRFAQVVSEYYGDAMITVEGFADPSGNAQYNLRLGERRAEAVMTYLAAAGIPSDRMRAVSYGSAPERQIVAGATGPGDGGWQNRRVAMVVDFGPSETRPTVALEGAEDR